MQADLFNRSGTAAIWYSYELQIGASTCILKFLLVIIFFCCLYLLLKDHEMAHVTKRNLRITI